MKNHRIIGLMSGTSLDGVDLAFCEFAETGTGYTFSIGACETVPYPGTWLARLKTLPEATAMEYAETHTLYGRYLGELTKNFIRRNKLEAELVASHGHTIFHNPSKHYTAQIGEGAAIAAGCGLPVVCDFRTGDVAVGGQGAPLVPAGDQLLFGDYDYCLNLGGFANISMQVNDQRIAYDISPANIVLNYIAAQKGKRYDKDGKMAEAGNINTELLETLNSLGYYHMQPPKSLGREWVEKEILPMFTRYVISAEDAACTFCEHISIQVAAVVKNDPSKQMLVTGGGAFNNYLIKRLAENTSAQICIPDKKTVNYKEALIFAFLGLLRMEGKTNSLATVTGARYNVSCGAIYLP